MTGESMKIREDFKDILIVDENGRIEYFSIESLDFFDLKPEELLGTKVPQLYANLDEETSTLMKAANSGVESVDCVQTLITSKGKLVRQVSDTLCIKKGDQVAGAIEFAYYDETRDVIKDNGTCEEKRESPEEPMTLDDLIGQTPEMLLLKHKLKKVFDLESPILLTGESGTGKEMTARIIHSSSKRAEGQFVYVNCSALPENLLEGLLFGIRKGSFTDAEEKEGLFQMADKGTLFLDEINSMPLNTQAKILRAIEEKKIRPVGGDELYIDTRIIAACNVSADELIYSSQVRKDLYFRLSVIQFELPPLRRRGKDILLLTEHFIAYFNKKVIGLDEKTKNLFENYSWPGNIRELRNTIEGAFHTTQTDCICYDDIFEKFEGGEEKTEDGEQTFEEFCDSGLDLITYLECIEEDYIAETLKTEKGNLKKAAKELGIRDQVLKYKMEKYKIVL